MGAEPLFLGYTIAVFCAGEMVGAIVFGKTPIMQVRDPERGPARVLCVAIFCGFVGSVLYVAGDSLRSPMTACLQAEP